jgi:hypothetical protein
MTSRRRRGPPRSTGQDRSIKVTAPQGGPSGPALIKDRISTTPVDDDLHFKTGLWGSLARFFVRLRAAGDPYDETLVLPALIVIITMKLNDSNRLEAWIVAAAIIVTGIAAGARLGASPNYRTFGFQLRIFLRAISAGAIESAGFALVYAGKFTYSSAIAANLVLINIWMYWLAAIIVSIIHDNAVITETEWQAGRARLALLRKFILRQSTNGASRLPQATSGARPRHWSQVTRAQRGHIISSILKGIRIIKRVEKFVRELLRIIGFWATVSFLILALVAPQLGNSVLEVLRLLK